MIINHDTAATIATIKKHLGFLNPRCDEITDYEGRNESPVSCVEIDYTCRVYPQATKDVSWAVDIMVDVTETNAGITGFEPQAHSEHSSLGEALVEVAAILVRDRVRGSLDQEKVDQDYWYDDSMDGDHESALASCGWGTDEDYGYFGDEGGF